MAAVSDENAAFERLAQSTPPLDDRVLVALEAELGSEPRARGWSRRTRLGLSLGLLALALALTSLRSLGGALALPVFLALGCSLGLGVFFLPAAVPGRNRWAHRPRQLLVVAILVVTSAQVAWTTSAFAPLASLAQAGPRSTLARCGLHVLLTAGLCLTGLLLPWRRVDPFSPTLLGALLGAFAGFSGMLSVDAGCASTEGFHLVFGHASAVIVFGLLGAVLGRRWLSP